MTQDEATTYTKQRRAELPQMEPVAFINLIIQELWTKFQFRSLIGGIPVEGVSIVNGMMVYHVAEPFDLVRYYMKHVA